jgi:hypothetical protein
VKVSQEKGLAKQGYLYKQGKTGRWALRYVVLKEGQLSWFKRWKVHFSFSVPQVLSSSR